MKGQGKVLENVMFITHNNFLSKARTMSGKVRRARERWKNVAVREELYFRARRVVEAGIGYRSVSDFTADALRRRLEEVEPLLEKLPKAPARPPAGVRAEQGGRVGGMSPASSFEEAKKEVVVGG